MARPPAVLILLFTLAILARVSAAPATQLVVTQSPSTPTTAGSNFATSVIVEARDGSNVKDTGFVGLVTLSVTTGTGTLLGTVSKNAVAGEADFSAEGLHMTVSGTGKVITATAGGLTDATTASFDIDPAAKDHWAITTQPVDTVAGTIITVVAEMRDTYNNPRGSGTPTTYIQLQDGTGTLDGVKDVKAVAGVASFCFIWMDVTGSKQLRVYGDGITAVDSVYFNINAGPPEKIVVTVQPPDPITANTAFGLTAEIQDAGGNVVTSETTSLSVRITAGMAGTLSGTTSMNAVSGVAAFTNLVLNSQEIGSVRLEVTAASAPASVSVTNVVGNAEAVSIQALPSTTRRHYTDRTYEVNTGQKIPESYYGHWIVKTRNDDKYSTAGTQYSFDVDTDVLVHVMYDARVECAPNWLRTGYSPKSSADNIVVSNGDTFMPFYTTFSGPTTISFGGNYATGLQGTSVHTNYWILVKPTGGLAHDVTNAVTVEPVGTMTISGTFLDGSNEVAESTLWEQGGTMILTLAGDTWVASGAAFDAQRPGIVAAFSSVTATQGEWSQTVTIPVDNIVRDSATQVTITIPATPGYWITTNDVVSVTLPVTAFTSSGGYAFSFTVNNEAPKAVLSGAFASAATESNVMGGGLTLDVSLYGSQWKAGGDFDGQKMNILNAITPNPLINWTSADIGDVAANGTMTETATGFSIQGSGKDIWNREDEFHFAFIEASGDCAISGLVESITNSHTWAKAGLMFRDTLDDDSRHVFLTATRNQNTAYQWRPSVYALSQTANLGSSPPMWLRFEKVGQTFIAYTSNDGSSWTYSHNETVAITDPFYVGMAVTSHNDGVFTTAEYGQVVLTCNGLLLQPTPEFGWSNEVQPGFTTASVVRVNDTSIRVTLPAAGNYDIQGDELLAATFPASSVVSGEDVSSANSIPISAEAATVSVVVTTPNSNTVSESVLSGAAHTLTLTVANDKWRPSAAGQFDAIRSSILSAFTVQSASAPRGWVQVVAAAWAVGNVMRSNDRVVTIPLPDTSNYLIRANEVIQVSIPLSSLVGMQSAATSMSITDVPAVVGMTAPNVTEWGLIHGDYFPLTVTVTHDEFNVTGIADWGNSTLASLVANTSEANGWNARIQPRLHDGYISTPDAFTLQIRIPQESSYAISASEYVEVTLPVKSVPSFASPLTLPTRFPVEVYTGPPAAVANVRISNSSLNGVNNTGTVEWDEVYNGMPVTSYSLYWNTGNATFLTPTYLLATLTVRTFTIYDVVDVGVYRFQVIANAVGQSSPLSNMAILQLTPSPKSTITLSPTPALAVLTEGIDNTTFTIQLPTAPTVAVTVTTTASALDIVPTPSVVTFTPADWSTPQTVLVTTSIDDSIGVDASRTLSLASVSGDYAYAGLSTSLAVTVRDTDARLVTSATTLPGLSEVTPLTGGTFTVSLGVQCLDPVVVNVAVDSQLSLETATTLSFTATDWSTPQTVSVNVVQDTDVEASPHSGIVSIGASSSAVSWNFVTGAITVTAAITDDDAKYEVTPTAASTLATPIALDEDGTKPGLITIVLKGKPTSPVVFTATPDTQVKAAPTALSFTSTDWSVVKTITVTAVDDDEFDGVLPHTGKVKVSLDGAGSDANFIAQQSSLYSEDFIFAITDNDVLGTPSMMLSSPMNGTTETSAPFTMSVVFTSLPFKTPSTSIYLNLTLTSDTPSHLALSPVAKSVTVADALAGPIDFTATPVRNHLADTGKNVTVTASLSWAPSPIVSTYLISVLNKDSVGMNASTISGPTSESGSSATFTVWLSSKPVADVTCQVSAADPTETSVSTPSITFTANDQWSTPRVVTVVGVDDTETDSLQLGSVSVGGCVGDPAMTALSANVSVLNLDDEGSVFGFQFLASGNETSENPDVPPVDISLALSEPPVSDTVISASISDTNLASFKTPSSVTFSSATWSQVQVIKVQGVQDDGTINGDRSFTLQLGKSGGSGGVPAEVSMALVDDDTETILTSSTGPCTTNEQGLPYLVNVRLGGRPEGDVTVAPVKVGEELTVTPASLTFTPQNYAGLQVVTIRGVRGKPSVPGIPVQVQFASTTEKGSGLFAAVNSIGLSCTNRDVNFPSVGSVTPDTITATKDTVITIEGVGFRPDGGASPSVFFNDFAMPVNSSSDTAIVVMYQASWGVIPSSTAPSTAANVTNPALRFALLQDQSFRLDGWIQLRIVNNQGARIEITDLLYVATRCTGENERLDEATDTCKSCSAGMVCKGGGRVEGADGFFVPEGADEAVQCRPPQRCGGADGSGGGCSPGYAGPGCGQCDSGYFKEGQLCKKCSEDATVKLLALISSAGAIIVLAGLFVFAALVCRDETFTDLVDAVAAVQLVQAIGRMSNPNLPSFMAAFYRHLSIVTLEYEAVGAGCNGGVESFIDTFWSTLTFVFAIIVPVMLVFTLIGAGLLMLRHKRASSKLKRLELTMHDDEDAANEYTQVKDLLERRRFFMRNRLVRITVIVAVLVYVTVATVVIKALHCIKIGQYQYLALDFGIRCYAGAHMNVAMVAWALVILYIAGFPIGSSVYLFVNRKVLYTNPAKKARYGFLFEELKPRAYWFASLAMLTELALVVASVVYTQDPLEQFLVSGGTLFVYLMVVIIVRPFRKMIENILVIFASSVGILASGLNYASGTQQPWGNDVYFSLSVTVFALCIAVLVLAFALILNAVSRGKREDLRRKFALFSLRKAKARIRSRLLDAKLAESTLQGPALEAYREWISNPRNLKALQTGFFQEESAGDLEVRPFGSKGVNGPKVRPWSSGSSDYVTPPPLAGGSTAGSPANPIHRSASADFSIPGSATTFLLDDSNAGDLTESAIQRHSSRELSIFQTRERGTGELHELLDMQYLLGTQDDDERSDTEAGTKSRKSGRTHVSSTTEAFTSARQPESEAGASDDSMGYIMSMMEDGDGSGIGRAATHRRASVDSHRDHVRHGSPSGYRSAKPASAGAQSTAPDIDDLNSRNALELGTPGDVRRLQSDARSIGDVVVSGFSVLGSRKGNSRTGHSLGTITEERSDYGYSTSDDAESDTRSMLDEIFNSSQTSTSAAAKGTKSDTAARQASSTDTPTLEQEETESARQSATLARETDELLLSAMNSLAPTEQSNDAFGSKNYSNLLKYLHTFADEEAARLGSGPKKDVEDSRAKSSVGGARGTPEVASSSSSRPRSEQRRHAAPASLPGSVAPSVTAVSPRSDLVSLHSLGQSHRSALGTGYGSGESSVSSESLFNAVLDEIDHVVNTARSDSSADSDILADM